MSKLLKFGFIYTFANGIQKCVGFFSFMYLANILSIEDYSKFGKYYALFAIISSLSFAGVIEVGIGEIQKYKSKKIRLLLFRYCNSLFVFNTVILTVILIGISLFKGAGWKFTDIIIVYLSALMNSYFQLQSQLVRLNQSHLPSIILTFMPTVTGYLVGLYLVYLYGDIVSLFLGIILSNVLCLFIYIRKDFIFFGISKKLSSISKFLKMLPPFSALSFISWLMGYGMVYFIDIMYEEEQVALYFFLYTISSIVLLIGTSMNQVWSPNFFNEYNKTRDYELEKDYGRYTLLQGLVLGSVSAFLLIALPYFELISKNYTQYTSNHLFLSILLLGYVVSIPWWHGQNYFYINGKGMKLFKIITISSFVGLILWLLMMKVFGEMGIYIGFLLSSLTRSLMISFASNKEWNTKFDIPGQTIGSLIIILTSFFIWIA